MKSCGSLGALDASRLEDYLSEQDFRSIFNMNKEDYRGLKKWKQSSLKKQHNMF
jgi:hypothetical protein